MGTHPPLRDCLPVLLCKEVILNFDGLGATGKMNFLDPRPLPLELGRAKSKKLRLESNNFSNPKRPLDTKENPKTVTLKEAQGPLWATPFVRLFARTFCKEVMLKMVWGPLQKILVARICLLVFFARLLCQVCLAHILPEA